MKLETIKWKELTEDEKIASLKRPVTESIEEQESVITEIFNEVKSNGDQAIKRYTKMYDGVEIDNLLMSNKEITSAFDRIPNALIQSIENAIENVKTFHEKKNILFWFYGCNFSSFLSWRFIFEMEQA